MKKGGWVHDEDQDAAIRLFNNKLGLQKQGNGKGYCWIRIGDVILYSCYISPNKSIEDFEIFLDELETSTAAHRGKHIVITGDFNAAGTLWGSQTTDYRGKAILEWMARNDLLTANDGIAPTFERRGQESYIDLTVRSGTAEIINWQVVEEETHSDHRYITFEIDTTQKLRERPRGWTNKNLNMDRLAHELAEACDRVEEPDDEKMMEVLQKTCEVSSKPARPQKGRRVHKYWWTKEIAMARKACNEIRRRCVRQRRRDGGEEEQMLHKQKKAHLKFLIKLSKEKKWKEIREGVEQDPWGDGYLIVMKKIGIPPPIIPDEVAHNAITQLFPTHTEQVRSTEDEADEDIGEAYPITLEEVEAVAARIKARKAAGPDGIPPEAVKILMKERPGFFAAVVEKLLAAGRFPKTWKTGRLVLLLKPGKPPGEPSAYRPLCLLSTAGKAVEGLLASRLVEELDELGAISDAQHGFRRKRSTVTAIKQVMKIAEEERSRSLRTRKLCLVVLLDVKNAFNSISWAVIRDALREKGISGYLRRMLDNYLHDRAIEWNGNTHKMTAGVPQGSVLGPILWSVAYDGVLRLEYPEGVTPVAYADDLALVITDKDEEELEEKANHAIQSVEEWMEERMLKLAPMKTEAALLIGRKKCRRDLQIVHGGHTVPLKKEVKYLGVILDQGMTFSQHVRYASAKAEKTVSALVKLMPRTWGAGEEKRRLLATVADSTVTYASPVWQNALTKQRNRNLLRSTQRALAIRISRAYRTVATLTVMVIATVIPWDYLVKERSILFEDPSKVKDAREATIANLQAEWELGEPTWTRRLVTNLAEWYTRKHGNTTYRLTQVLTGHGCFQAYLFRIGKITDPTCVMCSVGEIDDTEHTIFRCVCFDEDRRRLEEQLGTRLTVSNMVPLILADKANWEAVQNYAEKIIAKKEERERSRSSRTGSATEAEDRTTRTPADVTAMIQTTIDRYR